MITLETGYLISPYATLEHTIDTCCKTEHFTKFGVNIFSWHFIIFTSGKTPWSCRTFCVRNWVTMEMSFLTQIILQICQHAMKFCGFRRNFPNSQINIPLMECSNAFHSTAMLHFSEVYGCNEIYMWFYFSSTDIFSSREQIYLCRRRVNANLILQVQICVQIAPPPCVHDLNQVSTASADGLAPKGAGPSTGAVLTTQMCFLRDSFRPDEFEYALTYQTTLFWPSRHITQ